MAETNSELQDSIDASHSTTYSIDVDLHNKVITPETTKTNALRFDPGDGSLRFDVFGWILRNEYSSTLTSHIGFGDECFALLLGTILGKVRVAKHRRCRWSKESLVNILGR